MTRKIDALLAEYGESHQNPTNKAVHWVCVPVIFWTVTALVWALPVPEAMAAVGINWLGPVFLAVIGYYVLVLWQLAIGITAVLALCAALNLGYESRFALPLWQFAVGVFVLAWIGQFWGHKVEGKKPSFFKDVQFLLIGPAWLLHFLYRKAGIPY